eukprot:scaffold16228_cov210-Amphora_coffeaeformis.AAC.1
MLRMMLVKSTKATHFDMEGSLNHGTKIIKYLVAPWARSNRVVVADSYFASVQTEQELFKMGLRFIGVVKTATKGFPMKQLTSAQFGGRGQWTSFIHIGDGTSADPDLLAFAWVDRNRRYFISLVSNLQEAAPIQRQRLRQVDTKEDATPEKVHLTIRQPIASKLYYDNCGCIDQHNRVRQADLSYLLWKSVTGSTESSHDFFSALAEEMIDYGRITRAQLKAIDDLSPTLKCNTKDGNRQEMIKGGGGGGDRDRIGDRFQKCTASSVASGVGPYITPMKKKCSPGKEGKLYSEQKRCTECGKKTTWECSECKHNGLTVPVCHTRVRCACWDDHIKEAVSLLVVC